MQRILVIEDEPDLREGLRHNLELEGYDVDAAGDGELGLARATAEPLPDLVLLDLMLPKMGGLDVLRNMRREGRPQRPVIVLSAKGQEADKVAGLELGADDYLSKPFGLAELFARIRAVLRRADATRPSDADEASERFSFSGLVVDFSRFTVERDGQEHQLSRYEGEILRMLVSRRGQVVSRKDLLQEVWGYVHLPTTRTVDNHIARLRKKVEINPENPRFVVTVHGLGYRFDGEDAPN
jgi:DNA-binding response OmpR family regulator